MNKNIKTIVIAGLACVAFCGTTFAAPHGGKGGRGPQKAPAHQQVRPAQGARGFGGGHAVKAPARHNPAPAHHAARPPARHTPPPRPRYHARHHWARPVCPPPRFGALHAWNWVATTWEIIIDGICYFGDGYYYDGYNYYYNGAYYTTPPGVGTVVYL